MPNKHQEFQPKTFVSRRGANRDKFVQNEFFGHKAEDYMDDEDFGEFGIAPKKIRLASGFSTLDNKSDSDYSKVLRPSSESIGEKILRCMTGGANKKCRLIELKDSLVQKRDYHGLGYKPLKHRAQQLTSNPLEATLKHGQKLRISGEAFGVGVLDNNDDDLHQIDEYGYDNISNYEFKEKSKTLVSYDRQEPCQRPVGDDPAVSSQDPLALTDFIPATDKSVAQICEDEQDKYLLPKIETDWKQPRRSEPFAPPEQNSKPKQDVSLYQNQASKFSGKFTSGITKTVVDNNIVDRMGLIPYSDLKAIESQQSKPSLEPINIGNKSKITMSRRTIEWRPCSLLCKHFNVPNPYPDNSYFGVKQADLSAPDSSFPIVKGPQLAALELRRSIYNVTFDDCDVDADDEGDSSEDEPQYVETKAHISDVASNLNPTNQLVEKESDEDPEVIVIDAPKNNPEVIVLSSSSSSSPTFTHDRCKQYTSNTSDDDDTYGPPLPPSRLSLRNLDIKGSSNFSPVRERGKHKKKSKKHKKSRHR